MPEFLEDPSVLTKDKLKSELVANSVALPAGEQRKDVYVQLYLRHLTPRNRPDFSSDDERDPTPPGAGPGQGRRGAGRKATKKTDKPRQEEKEEMEVTELTNEDLLDQLVKYGVNPGPIVGSTRKLYEKKLLKLREQGTESRPSTPLPTISSAENTRQNGSNDSDRYSDNEEGKKKEHEEVKSTRDFVPFSELPTPPSGGFFQGISFPDISTRPPLGRTEQQAVKKVPTCKGQPRREPLATTALLGRGQVQKSASGGFPSSGSSQERGLEKSPPSSCQRELDSMLVAAAASASPPVIKESTTTCYKDMVERIYHGEKRGIPPLCTERSQVSESERSQVISPPLAREIRDYVNSLLVQAGVDALPGPSDSAPPLERTDPSRSRDPEPVSPPQKRPRLCEKSAEQQDPGSFVTFQSEPEPEPMSFAKTVVSRSLRALGIDVSKPAQQEKVDAPGGSFPFHESVLKVIQEEWQQIDRPLPSLAYSYPLSSSEAAQILSVPRVDQEVLGSASESAQGAGSEPYAPQLDLAFRTVFEAAAASVQVATHAAFVARAVQADIGQAARILSSDPSCAPQALDILSRTYDAASFLCEAAFDEVKLAAHAMGSSTLGRRYLWLKDCQMSPASKNRLLGAPFKGGALFGGEVSKVVKKRGGKRQAERKDM